MRPALDPAGHWVPRTKPTCLLHTWSLTDDDLSHLFFTYTNTSQAATCTCITWPRISPHNIINHSLHQEATIHRSSNHTWSSGATTLNGTLQDAAEASLSLPTVESDTYLSMGELVPPARPPLHGPCNCAGPRRAAAPGTSRFPHGATNTKCRYSIRAKTRTHRDPDWKNTKVENS
jgi:hypothetical protein